LRRLAGFSVFDLERATFNNIEEMNIEFVQESLSPTAVRIEQTIYKDLLTAGDQEQYYAKWLLNGLMRGNIAARTAYYNMMRQNGAINADEMRELEDMNLIPPGTGGDAYLVNGNMISLKNAENNLPKSMQKGAS
jgi:phage portal protein BeeE